MRHMKIGVVAACLVLGLVSIATAQSAVPDKSAKLRNPATLTEQAPATYKVKFETSKGVFVVEVHRDWAPLGADRFYNLVKNGFYDDVRFFRVVPKFMVQFGIHGTPAVGTAWENARIKDDPVRESNKRGYVSFATAGPNTRTTQVFINFGDNAGLDRQGFAPFGRVTSGMDVVDQIASEYGEKPDQRSIRSEGNTYLNKEFPRLDYIKTATIEP